MRRASSADSLPVGAIAATLIARVIARRPARGIANVSIPAGWPIASRVMELSDLLDRGDNDGADRVRDRACATRRTRRPQPARADVPESGLRRMPSARRL